MKTGLIAALILTTTAAGALAAPVKDAGVTAATVEKQPVEGLLREVGYSLQQREDGTIQLLEAGTNGQFNRRQGFPTGGQCEGYQPQPGCVITYNDGDYCTERCGPILQVCGCVF